MPSNTGSGLHRRSASRSRTGNRKFLHETVAGTLAVEQVAGFEGCNHKTTTITRTLKEPRARRNASTGGSGAPDCSRQVDPDGIRPNRHSLTVPRLNNSSVQRATETRFRRSSLYVDPFRLR